MKSGYQDKYFPGITYGWELRSPWLPIYLGFILEAVSNLSFPLL